MIDHSGYSDHRCSLCEEFAEILGAEILTSTNNLCAVTFQRRIPTEILDRRTHSPLALAALFSFESMDERGNTLNLGETVILQDEINPFISILREHGILLRHFTITGYLNNQG